jgi:hypothetical protein
MMPCQEPVRILLVDDSEDNRLLIRNYSAPRLTKNP